MITGQAWNYLWSWEVMRRIGFRPEEIFLAVTPPGGLVQPTPRAEARRYDQPVIACEVRRGDKKFLWDVHSYRAASTESDLEHCPRCHTELEPLSKVRYEHPATWRRYSPIEFHMITLKANGLGFAISP